MMRSVHPPSSGQPQSQTMTLALGLPAQTPAAMALLTSAITSGPERFAQRGQPAAVRLWL